MIGMVPSFLEHCLPTIPLMLAAITFTIGMIFLGVRIVIDLHLDTAVCQDLINDKRLVLKFQVTPDKAYENYLEGQNNPRRKLFTRAPFRLLAFVCFIMGCLIAIGGIVWVVEIADGLQSKKECVTAKKAD